MMIEWMCGDKIKFYCEKMSKFYWFQCTKTIFYGIRCNKFYILQWFCHLFFLLSFASFFLLAEARAEIVGPQIRYLTPSSTLKLMCRIVQNTEASAFIFWYHDNRMINYDSDRGINVSTEAGTCPIFILLHHIAGHQHSWNIIHAEWALTSTGLTHLFGYLMITAWFFFV